MSGARSSLLLAATISYQVIDNQQSLDEQLHKAFADVDKQQQPLLQELSYGVCRYYGYYDAVLARLMKKPIKSSQRIVHFILVCALHQLTAMKTPDYAVVNECAKLMVRLKKTWAKALVNGVLRQFLRRQDEFADLYNARDELSFDNYVGQQLADQWPLQVESMRQFLNARPPLTLRVNALRQTRQAYVDKLAKQDVQANVSEETQSALTLVKAVPVEKIPGFYNGEVSVQDVSAQFAADLLDLKPGLQVLDACAAPGGKTGELLEVMPDIELTALDLPARVAMISENLTRLQLNAKVVAKPLAEYVKENADIGFDRILLDAPCSGSGVIARHPDIRYRRVQGDIEKFQAQQQALLNHAWSILKPDGLLLYITCSVFKQENVDVIDAFLQTHDDAVERSIKDENIGMPLRYGVQRLPGVHAGDGFYYCLLLKKHET